MRRVSGFAPRVQIDDSTTLCVCAAPFIQCLVPTLLLLLLPQFYDYQLPFVGNFPLNAYNASWNVRNYVSVHCTATNLTSGTCVNSAGGGNYRGDNATIEMSVIQPGAVIRYTMDGSAPTASSALYTTPINVAAMGSSVTLSCAAFASESSVEPLGVTTTALYSRWCDSSNGCANAPSTLSGLAVVGITVGSAAFAGLATILYRFRRKCGGDDDEAAPAESDRLLPVISRGVPSISPFLISRGSGVPSVSTVDSVLRNAYRARTGSF